MKILQIHNTYQHKGGEDSVVQAERDLLTSENNEVLAYFVTNDTIQGLKAKIATGLNSHYSKSQKSNLYSYLVTNRPDIVHCHNFFPLLTPSIYDACIEAGIPIVQTLHNYRAICAGALLMRHGKICEQCINGTPYQSVIYQCYRQSVIGSLTNFSQ